MPQNSLYDSKLNQLVELPQISKPKKPRRLNYDLAGALHSASLIKYETDLAAYNAHLATLRKIPCDPSCKGLWADGQKVVEGKDYEVRSICIGNGCYAGIDHPCVGCEKRAFPLVPVGEDELWDDVVTIVAGSWSREKIIAELKQKYLPLTKR